MGDLDTLCGGVFNARQAMEDGGNGGGVEVPPGWYPVQVENVEVRDTKQGNGKYVSVMYNIIGDSYNGAKLFDCFNIVNNSARAVQIGRARLGEFCINAGVPDAHDTQDLFMRTLEVKVKVVKDKDGSERSIVGQFRPLGGTEEAPAAAPVQAPAPAAYAAPAPAPAAAPVASAPARQRPMPWTKPQPAPIQKQPATPDDMPF